MEVLSKDNIEKWILPFISSDKYISRTQVPVYQVVQLVFYKLKTGCQWRYIPLDSFFKEKKISWEGVYYHFRKWVKNGSWQKIWVYILKENKKILDLSSVQLDGSHTPAKRGGEKVAYQGRKSAKTTNMLYMCDNQGNMLACASPQSGNQNDLYEIKILFNELLDVLKMAEIEYKGLFMNADAGFDGNEFRDFCEEKEIEANIPTNKRNKKCTSEETKYQFFDEVLYKRRILIEHANAWMDGYKTLLTRFETKTETWLAFIQMSFVVRFLNKNAKRLKC